MDMSLSKYPLIIEQDLYKSAFRTSKEAAFFRKKVDRVYHEDNLKSHIWDIQFGFAITSNGGLSIVPSKNLVTNIGYKGTHSETRNKFHDRPVDENYKILSHPDFVSSDANYDAYHFKHHWNNKTSIIRKTIQKINKIIKLTRNK